jgi:hypothetical protein
MAAPPPVPPIADADRYVRYAPTSSTSTFAVTFPVFGDGSDLRLFLNGAPVARSNFSFSSASGAPISGIALPITDGQVTLGPISSGTLEIFGEWRARQGILDTSPAITRREYQQDLGQVVAGLREAWTAILSTFPLSKAGRANSYLGFDSQGNPFPTTTIIPGSITVSAAMAPVIAAADYATALGIMGFSSFFQTLIGAANAAAFYAAIGGTSFGASLVQATNAAAALTTLGVSAFMQSVLPAANAAAALTTLGLTSFGQALVGAANAAAALTQLGLSSLAQNVVAQPTAGAWQNLIGYTPPKRQTVVGGPVDAGGLPNFLPATSASLAVTSQLITASTPLVVTAANGVASGGAADLVGMATANLTWSGLTASTTNYLYVTVNAGGTLTPGWTTLAPIYQSGGTPNPALGQFTYSIAAGQGFLGNGSAAPQTPLVFVGEAVTGTTGITSTVAYAYNAGFISAPIAIPGASSGATFTHNLGLPPAGYLPSVKLVCVTTNLGYPVGAEVPWAQAGNNGGTLSALDSKKAQVSIDAVGSISMAPSGGGAQTPITNADWNLRLTVLRMF